jgi:hypothetical protein
MNIEWPHTDVVTLDDPFPHFVGAVPNLDYLAGDIDRLTSNPSIWKRHDGAFFSQWENSTPVEALEPLCAFSGSEATSHLRAIVAESLDCVLSSTCRVNLLRMAAGQRIAIHNDSPKLGFETHRVLVYLRSGQRDFTGGELLLFSKPSLDGLVRAYNPNAGTIFGFEASNTSYHAVAPVQGGSRLAVQYYFWHEGNSPATATFLRSLIETALDRFPRSGQVWSIAEALRSDPKCAVPHGDRTLADHLIETAAVLHLLGASEQTCVAGLVHSVEGTANFYADGCLQAVLADYRYADEVITIVKAFAQIEHGEGLIRFLTRYILSGH